MVTRTTAWVVHQVLVSYLLRGDSIGSTFVMSTLGLRRKPGKQQDGTDAVPGDRVMGRSPAAREHETVLTFASYHLLVS